LAVKCHAQPLQPVNQLYSLGDYSDTQVPLSTENDVRSINRMPPHEYIHKHMKSTLV